MNACARAGAMEAAERWLCSMEKETRKDLKRDVVYTYTRICIDTNKHIYIYMYNIYNIFYKYVYIYIAPPGIL